jgi:hypothetical protein
MQVGWKKNAAWSQSKGYCEFAASAGGTGFGNGTTIIDFTLQAAQHVYLFNESGGMHQCIVDNLFKGGVSTTWAGFTWADILIVGGESQSQHTQIGYMWPAKLTFTNIRQYSNNAWNLVALDPIAPAVVFPYGAELNGVGSMRNWTVQH